MARPIGAMLGVCLIGGLVLPGPADPVSAQDAVRGKVPQSFQYEGPTVLNDPQDPLQSVCWTLGLTIPARNRLPLGRQPASRQTDYDFQRQRVTVSYRSGEQDILPPLSYTGHDYGVMGFDRGLRSGWIEGNGAVMQESLARGGNDGGLLDISLPTIPFTDKLFGEGAPNLRVTGSEQITISGTSSWVVGQVTGERGGASLFPKLDMRQNLRVNLEGTIGSKLFINVSQNSDALTPLENSLQIRYRGEEDEVIQSVELGNTNLSLPPTQFVSYSSRQEGLFGVKTTASVGNLDFTAIASRQEGESGQATFTGGNQERKIFRKDWEFVPGKYFFITDPDTSPALDPGSMQIRVYVDDRTPTNNVADGAQESEVWVDPDARTPEEPYVGFFHLLQEEQDYEIFSSRLLSTQGYNITVLELTAPLSAKHVLAVTYDAVAGGERDTVGDFYRDPADTTLIQLKMIRPGDDKWGTDERNNVKFSTWNPCRRLEVKNVYYLGARDIDPGTFELRIVQDIAGPGGNNPFTLTNEFGVETPLIEVLGLDQKNNANTNDRTPDGRVDPEFIDYEDGVIWFPDLRPFDPSRTDISGVSDSLVTTPQYRDRSWPVVSADNYARPDTLGWRQKADGDPTESSPFIRNKEVVQEIYDLLPNERSLRASDFHKYSMEAAVKSASASTIQLTTIGAVLEGSETVRLNGQVLERGTDYTIFYETGTITLKKVEATAPGADLIVTYSFDSPFTRAQQSLLGGSLQTRPDPNAKLNFSTSWLHQSSGSPDRRPRLGQEPTKMTVGDVSGKLQLESWGLTRMMDAIPGVRTNALSRVEFWAAAGVSLPNPNTRGDVYIDDMEGANNVVAPGINRGAWSYSSAPVKAYEYMTRGEGTPLFEFAPNAIDRGELLWFSPNTVKVADITPREDSDQTRDDLVNVLETIYIPQENVGTGAWGGLVTPLAAGGVDISRAQFIEIWVNDYVNYSNREQRRGEILIDVGSVNEDAPWDPLTPPAPPNGTLDVEDKNQSGGQIDFDEDIGLDALFNEEESDPVPLRKGFSPAYPQPDRSGDDRVPEINTSARERTISERIAKYSGVNGTEANQRGDGEDLDGNFLLDQSDNYVEYRVDLRAPALVDNGRDFGIIEPLNGWRRYRIPIEEFHLSAGIPNLSLVKHMRIWFRGIDPGDTLDVQIASIEIVGNRWEASEFAEFGPGEIFNVATVNNRENPEYIPPYEVERINNVAEREQSLSLDFENFSPGNEFLAFNRQFEARDYTLYQTINYYVNPRLPEASEDSVEFFLRFGSDAASDDVAYYEIATILTLPDARQVANGWLEFAVPVADLSNLKVSGSVLPDSVVAEDVDLGNGLRATVVGAPSMSRVRRVSVGIRNITDRTLPLGRVWFDELRMGDVRRDRGVASRGFVSLQLADVANFQASADFNSADFLRLGDSDFRGSGSENIRYDLRGQVALHKFLSFLHINAPVALRLSRGKNTPKFRPNSDVLFTGESSGREITRTVDKNITLSLARDIRGGTSPITRYTIDGIRLNASAGQTFRDEVTVADSTYRKQGSVSYNLSLGHVRPIRPLGLMDFYLWPRTFTLSAAGGQVTRRTWSPEVFDPNVLRLTNNSLTKTGNMNLGTSFQPINGLTYSFASNRDLIDEHFDNPVIQEAKPPDTFLGINIGRQVLQTHNINFSYSPPILGTVRPRFTWTSGSNKNMSPSLTLENYAAPVFDIRNNNSANLSITVPLGKWMTGWFGPTRGGGTPTQPQQQPAGNDSALVPAPSGGGRGELAMLFTDVIRLKDIQVSGSVGHRSGYSRVNGTPPINYILGLTRDIGFGESVGPVENAPFNRSSGRSNGIRGNTAINIFRQIGVDLAYSKRRDTAQTNNLFGNIRDDTTWPEVTVNWGEIEQRLPFLNKIFSDFRIVSTNFSKVTGTNGTEINPKESVSSQTNWRPLLSISGTFSGWRTSMNANRSAMETVTERVGGGRTTSTRSQMSYAINFAKKFVRVVGGQGRDIDFKADVSYTTNSSENRSSFSDIPIQDKRDQLRLNTSAGIRLTSAMSGTIGIELGQERNVTKAWTRRSIRLYFSTGFSF